MTMIDEHLIPSSSVGQSTIFYYKMKGDYYRYPVEFKYGNDKKVAPDQSSRWRLFKRIYLLLILSNWVWL
ncbi:unnamed protein product [Lactuca virosa]|uniref:14-3-3 domain-containing protein n=1 Tax=Lactuca virosa TaxID=75947 RepID=A0AAU9PK27_9ASTR|nr:unnamed protein product [Lactuca virosa]